MAEPSGSAVRAHASVASAVTASAVTAGAGARHAPAPGGRADVITVRGLRMSYGHYEAVRGINLDVARGEILAFLGPNGAGKTTTVEILEGFRQRTGGEVRVLGTNPPHPRPACPP